MPVLVRGEQAVAGQDEDDARGLDAFDGRDGPFQFALKGALIVDLLGEFRQAELRLFKEFKARRGIARKAGGGQQQASAVDLAGRHVDGVTVVAQLHGDFFLIDHDDADLLIDAEMAPNRADLAEQQ